MIAITMFHGLAVGWADLVLPATASLERDGTLLNLEGRLQRLRRAVVPPVARRARLDREARRTLRGRALTACRGGLRRAVCAGVRRRRRRRAARRHRRAARRARLRALRRRRRGAAARSSRARPGEHFLGELRLDPLPAAVLGPVRRARPELEFQRPPAELELSAADAERRAIATATRSSFARTAPRSSCARVSTASSSRASRASPRSTPPTSTRLVEVVKRVTLPHLAALVRIERRAVVDRRDQGRRS